MHILHNTGINNAIKQGNFTLQPKALHLLIVHLVGSLEKFFAEHHIYNGLLVLKQ